MGPQVSGLACEVFSKKLPISQITYRKEKKKKSMITFNYCSTNAFFKYTWCTIYFSCGLLFTTLYFPYLGSETNEIPYNWHQFESPGNTPFVEVTPD